MDGRVRDDHILRREQDRDRSDGSVLSEASARRRRRAPASRMRPLWRDRLLAQMPDLRLTLLVGGHAQTDCVGARAR